MLLFDDESMDDHNAAQYCTNNGLPFPIEFQNRQSPPSITQQLLTMKIEPILPVIRQSESMPNKKVLVSNFLGNAGSFYKEPLRVAPQDINFVSRESSPLRIDVKARDEWEE